MVGSATVRQNCSYRHRRHRWPHRCSTRRRTGRRQRSSRCAHEAICYVQACIAEDRAVKNIREELYRNAKLCKQHPGRWKAHLRRGIEILKKIELETKDEALQLVREHAPKHLQRVLVSENGQVRNVPAMRRLTALIGHPDKKLPEQILKGFPTIGNQTESNVWGLDETKHPLEQEQIDALFEAGVTLRKLKPKGFSDKLLDAVLEEQMQMVKRGHNMEISEHQLHCMPAYIFPKEEIRKIRPIVDERRKNMRSVLLEKLQLYGTRVIQELMQAMMAPIGQEKACCRMPATTSKKEVYEQMQQHLEQFRNRKQTHNDSFFGEKTGRDYVSRVKKEARYAHNSIKKTPHNTAKQPLVELGSEDYKGAYHQVGCEIPEHNPAAAWSSHTMSYQYFLALVLNMGNLHSVPSWCRVAELCMSILIHFYAVAVIYIDDGYYMALDREGLMLSRELYRQMARTLGLVISEKPGASQNSCEHNPIKALGINYFWRRELNKITVEPTADSMNRALTQTEHCVEKCEAGQGLTMKDLQRVLGIANFIVCNSAYRAGNEIFRGIYDWTGSDERFDAWVLDKARRRKLAVLLRGVQVVLKNQKPLVLKPQVHDGKTNWLYLDASSNGSRAGGPCGGALLITGTGQIRAITYDFPDVSEHYKHPLTIEHYEAMMIRVAQLTWRHELSHSVTFTRVDNTGELYAAVKCSANSLLTTNICTRAAMWCHEYSCRSWYEYVKSELNCADPFSRYDKLQQAIDMWQPTMDKPPLINWQREFAGPVTNMPMKQLLQIREAD